MAKAKTDRKSLPPYPELKPELIERYGFQTRKDPMGKTFVTLKNSFGILYEKLVASDGEDEAVRMLDIFHSTLVNLATEYMIRSNAVKLVNKEPSEFFRIASTFICFTRSPTSTHCNPSVTFIHMGAPMCILEMGLLVWCFNETYRWHVDNREPKLEASAFSLRDNTGTMNQMKEIVEI